ncbi:IS sequence [Rhodococcus qingshengii BKS 20-40]|nr:IS sequence [Rhodococcus qingshengii BKS 20-40]
MVTGLTVTDPLHVKSAARLREQFQQPMPVAAGEDRLMRDLGDYDRAFGVEFPCTASCNGEAVQ